MNGNKERFIQIGKLSRCLFCEEVDAAQLTRDHFFPNVLTRRPKNMANTHPFRVVVDSPFNKFTVCRTHHERIDDEKIQAFKAHANHKNVDPVGLIKYLMTYPLSDNIKYYDLQLGAMTEVNGLFISTVSNLNGELPHKLVSKYKDASKVAEDFDWILKDRRILFDRSYISMKG